MEWSAQPHQSLVAFAKPSICASFAPAMFVIFDGWWVCVHVLYIGVWD